MLIETPDAKRTETNPQMICFLSSKICDDKKCLHFSINIKLSLANDHICFQLLIRYIKTVLSTYQSISTRINIVACYLVHATNKMGSSSDDWIY
jgi:hypothetical protein